MEGGEGWHSLLIIENTEHAQFTVSVPDHLAALNAEHEHLRSNIFAQSGQLLEDVHGGTEY